MSFESIKNELQRQFQNQSWIEDSGETLSELKQQCWNLACQNDPKPVLKAKIFEYIMDHAQIAICPEEWFADSINHGGVLVEIREKWKREAYKQINFPEQMVRGERCFAFTADEDFGHVAPDWQTILQLGIPGIIKRLDDCQNEKIKNGTLRTSQNMFYETSIQTWKAISRLITRLSRHALDLAAENRTMSIVADNLKNLAEREPKTMHEAMQFMFIIYFLQTLVEGDNVRSLGMLDRLLYPYYQADIANGVSTKETEKELLKHFMYRFYAADVISNIPFGICGTDENGRDQTNELSYLILETYAELNILSPKIHVMCNEQTPEDIQRIAMDTIRKGNSSILFANDTIITKALQKIGIAPKDAANHLLVGCYEPAVIGKEVPCSCNGRINLPKAVEYALTNGIDLQTGMQIGLQTGDPDVYKSFEQFFDAVMRQYAFFADSVMNQLVLVESQYRNINPAPILSATLTECVERGVDAYEGGAKYNNSSINVFGFATAVDSLFVIRKIVFEEKRMSLQQFSNVLRNNWQGYENLRITCIRDVPKYGNNQNEIDLLATSLADRVSTYLNGKANGRGGCFRCGMFSIDWRMIFGEHTGASADGRLSGEPLSKNIGATTAMDKNGVTALIQSAAKIDYSNIPNGTVLDLLLHPTTVRDNTGMNAMMTLLRVYFANGGFAMHINVFDADTLKKAQINPENYATLQVRLCGWNAYFINLTREEQNDFIKQASMNH